MGTLIVPPFRTALLTSDGKPLSMVPGGNGAGGPQDGRITIETTKEWWLFWRTLAELGNAGLLMITFGLHGDRPAADSMPDGAIYVESDRSGVIYQNQGGEWHYLAGTMWGTLSPDQRPTDLGVNDAGFDFRSTDPPPREYIWSGTVWVESTGFLDPTTTKGDLIARGAAAPATRVAVGSNGQVLTADSAQALGVKWSTPAAAGIDGTPLTHANVVPKVGATPGTLVEGGITDDSAANSGQMRITAAGNVGIGSATVPIGISAFAGRTSVTIKGSTEGALFELATAGPDADNSFCALMSFVDSLNSQADKRIAQIHSFRSGTTALNRGGFLAFSTRADGASGPSERMRITAAGNVGIGATNPLSRLAVVGLPTSAAGLSSGDIWRDAAAGNVLKIVP